MRLVSLALIGLLSGCALSTTGKALDGGIVASGAWDLVETSKAEDRGGREWNRIAGDSELRRILVKSLGIGGVIGLAHLLEIKGKPILAHLVRGAVMTAWSFAAIHNHGLLR